MEDSAVSKALNQLIPSPDLIQGRVTNRRRDWLWRTLTTLNRDTDRRRRRPDPGKRLTRALGYLFGLLHAWFHNNNKRVIVTSTSAGVAHALHENGREHSTLAPKGYGRAIVTASSQVGSISSALCL